MLLRTQAQVSGHLPVLGFKSLHDSSGINKNNPVKPNKRVKTEITVNIVGKEKEDIYITLQVAYPLNLLFPFFSFPHLLQATCLLTFFFFLFLFLSVFGIRDQVKIVIKCL